MATQKANVGIAFKVPECKYIGASSASFSTWAINDISGSTVNPGTNYAFPEATTLYAIWKESKWKNNNFSTWAEANEEGWYGTNTGIYFSGTIDPSSVYNVPAIIGSSSVIGFAYPAGFTNKSVYMAGGKNIKQLTYNLFTYCESLVEVSFPECINIGDCAFKRCYALSSTYFPKVKQVYSYAFEDCSSLTRIDLSSCLYIDSYAFYSCVNLESISIPLCSYIGSYAFYRAGCRGNGFDLNIPVCSYIDQIAFNDAKLKICNIPMCSYIGSQAFNGCKMSYISAPNIIYIDNYGFSGCSNLTTISLPNCSYLGAGAFQCCYSLNTVYLYNYFMKITFERIFNYYGKYTFYKCWRSNTSIF